jgi:hypothetical protein
MAALKVEWALCRDTPVWAHSCAGHARDSKWYRCPECGARLIFCTGKKRNKQGTVMRNHFKHKSISACKGGGPMSYQHKMTQRALDVYRGPLRVVCCDQDCEGALSDVTRVQLECARVPPFKIDAVLTTTKGDVAVEVTYTHETQAQKWKELERLYGVDNTVDIDVSQASVEDDGRFELPHAGQFVAVGSESRNAVIDIKSFACLILRSRADRCSRCVTQQQAKAAAAAVAEQEAAAAHAAEQEAKDKKAAEAAEAVAKWQREGRKQCDACKMWRLKNAFATYYSVDCDSRVESCCGWKLCSNCNSRKICKDRRGCKSCLKVTTHTQCQPTCPDCGSGFWPEHPWEKKCWSCYRAGIC